MSSPDSAESCCDIFDMSFSGSSEAEEDTWAEVRLGREVLRLPTNRVHVWDSSQMLADWIVGHPQAVAGRRVLELGCGLALPAMAAALAGAKAVVATDLSEAACAQVRAAAAHNAAAYPQLEGLSAETLDWFKADESALGTFDCIIAADVNYERALTEPLTATVMRHLAPGAPLLLATRSGRVSLNDSLASLSQRLRLKETTDLHVSEDKHHLLYEFVRPAPRRP